MQEFFLETSVHQWHWISPPQNNNNNNNNNNNARILLDHFQKTCKTTATELFFKFSTVSPNLKER